jgi:hypothetical protein
MQGWARRGWHAFPVSKSVVVGLLTLPNICHACHKEAAVWCALTVWLCDSRWPRSGWGERQSKHMAVGIWWASQASDTYHGHSHILCTTHEAQRCGTIWNTTSLVVTSSAVHDVIVCYDSFNSLPTCRRTDRRQIAPDFPIPIFSEIPTTLVVGFVDRGNLRFEMPDACRRVRWWLVVRSQLIAYQKLLLTSGTNDRHLSHAFDE